MALISLRNIKKHYGGENGAPKVDVLQGINLDIYTGEFVAIVGSSGSGKSTLMHLLGCLDKPSSGEYYFNHRNVATLDLDQLAALRREAFGFVFQAYHLIPTESAIENVEIPAIYAGIPEAQRQAKARQLLQRLGLAERLHNRPAQLSGGQQQRVSIARALINGGSVILADEPTGALDSRSGLEVMELLRELADQGHTVILITHDYSVASQARRVIEVRDGKIVGDSGDLHTASTTSSDNTTTNDESPSTRTQQQSAYLADEIRDACRAAWRVMWLNRFRTGLTLLGIIIGVASVIIMLAVGEGAKREVLQQLNAMGPNMMYVGPAVPDSGGPRGVISEADIDAISQMPEVLRIMPILRDPALLRYGGVSRNYEVLATNESLPQINRWPVAQGRFYTDEDNRTIAPVVVLGHRVYTRLFPNGGDPLGKQILLNEGLYEIIGVMAEKGAESGYNNHDERVYIPRKTGMVRLFPKLRDESYINLEIRHSGLMNQAEQKLDALLLDRHGRDDFWLTNSASRLEAEMATSNSMTMMLGMIAAISLLVGGIGVMNVMLMTVRERTREIGIRVATGARQRDILRQFITESAMVSLLGGLIGAGLSGLIIIILHWVDVAVAPSITALLGAVSCALITGLIFGFMPARQAARLNPVIALAGE